MDALLLAAFASDGRRARLAVDLGAGAGAVGLSLLYWDSAARVILVELDEAASETARANIDANGWSRRGEVVRADVRDLPPSALGADLVVCNPPYIPPGRGRMPASPARAIARSGDLGCFAEAARIALGRRSRACFVYPAHALQSLFGSLARVGLVPKRLRPVHADRESPARIVLVEAQAAKGGGLVLLPPVYERVGGALSPEVKDLSNGVLTRLAGGPGRSPPRPSR